MTLTYSSSLTYSLQSLSIALSQSSHSNSPRSSPLVFEPDTASRLPVRRLGQTVRCDFSPPGARAPGPGVTALKCSKASSPGCLPLDEERTEGMTLAFLQAGDLRCAPDRSCRSEGVCVEALTPLCFRSDSKALSGDGASILSMSGRWQLACASATSAALRTPPCLALACWSGAGPPLRFLAANHCHSAFTHERIGELIGI